MMPNTGTAETRSMDRPHLAFLEPLFDSIPPTSPLILGAWFMTLPYKLDKLAMQLRLLRILYSKYGGIPPRARLIPTWSLK